MRLDVVSCHKGRIVGVAHIALEELAGGIEELLALHTMGAGDLCVTDNVELRRGAEERLGLIHAGTNARIDHHGIEGNLAGGALQVLIDRLAAVNRENLGVLNGADGGILLGEIPPGLHSVVAATVAGRNGAGDQRDLVAGVV